MKQSDILNTQTNAQEKENNSNSGEKLIEREKIEGTPFWIVGDKIKGYRVVLGKWQITEIHKTKQELLDWMGLNYYTIILTMIIVVGEDIQEKNKQITSFKPMKEANDRMQEIVKENKTNWTTNDHEDENE